MPVHTGTGGRGCGRPRPPGIAAALRCTARLQQTASARQNSQAPRAISAAANGISTTSTTSTSFAPPCDGRVGPRRRTAGARAPPLDERQHGRELQREHRREQRHLHVEETVAEIKRGRLLQARERAQQAGGQSQRGRQPTASRRGTAASAARRRLAPGAGLAAAGRARPRPRARCRVPGSEVRRRLLARACRRQSWSRWALRASRLESLEPRVPLALAQEAVMVGVQLLELDLGAGLVLRDCDVPVAVRVQVLDRAAGRVRGCPQPLAVFFSFPVVLLL